MTKMLASVNSVAEALLVLSENIDIIDLKQPAAGALGALPASEIKAIVTAIAKRRPISATIGDLPMQPKVIFNAVQTMAENDVDYIKMGFFPGGDWQAVLDTLALSAEKQWQLIAVLFADTHPNFDIIPQLKQAGFTGVMLDTMNKNSGSLTQIMSDGNLRHFIKLAKDQQLLCGLAGSLTISDIPGLLNYEPDYLGFRGALCEHSNRTGQLNSRSIQQIKQTLNPY